MENVLISKTKLNQILWILNCNTNILTKLWVKLFLSLGWVQAELAVYICTIMQCLFHTCNFRTFLIALLTLNFLLYEVRPQCR